MRIGMDVRYLSHGLVGGIHTYLENFVPALIGANGEHEYFLYADTKRPFELQSLPKHVTLRLLPYQNPLSTATHDLFMWREMARDKLDVAHFTASYGFGPAGTRTVITLQDEINILPMTEIVRGHAKRLRTVTMMTYLHFCTHAALRRADMVITVSEYSKRRIARYSSLDPDRIVPVPHACPRDIKRIQDAAQLDDVRQRLGLTRPFVLAEAFKNPGVLVRAWKLLPDAARKNREIIFFSRSENVLPVVHEAIAANMARLLVRPARRDLSALYSLADVFVFPSWIEGFGIPLLEAMTCGAPVIASDRGSIPEVAADAAMLMDAEDHQKLADYIRRLFEHPAERDHWQKLGLARAAQFAWPDIAQRALGVYQTAMSL
jgi:glycosyltransferase involved in cell wall biosynthesis